MKILISSGGTREPIDGVRFITNFSTGSTGAFLCDYFRAQGHEVTLLRAKDSVRPTQPGSQYEFVTFTDLNELLKMKLTESQYDAVFHLAAISDYSVDKIEVNGSLFEPSESLKLSSEPEALSLHLKRNTKLIGKLKDYATKKDFKLFGFKLTNTKSQEQRELAIKKISDNYEVDYVVHNDLSEIGEKHKTQIYKNGKLLSQHSTKLELAEALNKILKESL